MCNYCDDKSMRILTLLPQCSRFGLRQDFVFELYGKYVLEVLLIILT